MARALMGRPSCLLLDEPSMGLAPIIVQQIFDVIRGLKALGVTVLLIEQNAYGALQIATAATSWKPATSPCKARPAP
ncbi:high-affinity branched-chain amino acid transporter ATP-binding protein [Bordetella pertussis]|nr:high-affinity branched-chain amino acid transporter ATP-binding protein [Bordetella pertussis]